MTTGQLPKSVNWIRIQLRIGADQRNFLHHGLGDDEPVEGITMVQRQSCQNGGMFRLDRYDAKLLLAISRSMNT
jgi:hypothetical protein